MLIDFDIVYKFLNENGRTPRGVFHVGAHECEEKEAYNKKGISDSSIVWVDGNSDLVTKMKSRAVPNVYFALVDEVERDVEFHITNNGQSSSILEMGSHATKYPNIVVTETRHQRTTTIAQLSHQENIDFTKLNFWNFDIQGAELLALKGAGDLLKYADALYLEVNTEEVYKNCAKLNEMDDFLKEKGFVRVALSIYKNGRGVEDGWGDALYMRV
jgi:hypothetical protein